MSQFASESLFRVSGDRGSPSRTRAGHEKDAIDRFRFFLSEKGQLGTPNLPMRIDPNDVTKGIFPPDNLSHWTRDAGMTDSLDKWAARLLCCPVPLLQAARNRRLPSRGGG